MICPIGIVVTDPYLITHEDLTETVTGLGTQRDAADLALRAFVGWSPETNKVYIMEDRWDDAVWVGDHSWENAKGSGCTAMPAISWRSRLTATTAVVSLTPGETSP